jgi:HK97 family phage major capsid protein
MRKALLAAAGFAALASYPGAIFADAGSSAEILETLKVKKADLVAANDAIFAAADEGGIDVSDKDLERIEANAAEVEKIDRQIQARELAIRMNAGGGRRTVAEPNAATRPAGSGARVIVGARDQARQGFRSFGHFAQTVLNHTKGNVTDDVTRLRNSATTYGNEGTGTDGGFLVPPSFSTTIWQKVQAEEMLLNRCAQLVTDGNSMMIPKDETTPWQTSGGIQVYWEGEAQAATASKGLFEMGALRLAKLMALVPISEELIQDASGLESWLTVKAPGKMAAKINTAIVSGTGVGQPLGIIPSGLAVGNSVVQVAKETSQPSATVWFANVNKMYSRMYAPWRRNAVWLINQDIEPQLQSMAFQPSGAASMLPTAASTPAYLPPGGFSQSPYATLLGRPVVPIEACSALGTVGDIIFTDLTQYWALTKAGGIQTDTSIHLYFDQALTAFRFIFRVNGQPAWSSTITRQNGSSNELSWAVALQSR